MQQNKVTLKGVGSAKVTSRGVPLSFIINKNEAGAEVSTSPANYLLKVGRCVAFDTRARDTAFVADLEIVESDNPAVKVGSKSHTWYQSLTSDAGPGALKQFVLAVLGIDLGDTETVAKLSEGLDDFINDKVLGDQAFNGKLVRCRVDAHTTKEKKIRIGRHTFSPA